MSPDSPVGRAHELLDLRSPTTPDDETFDVELSGLDSGDRSQQQRLNDGLNVDSEGNYARAAGATASSSKPIWQRRGAQVGCAVVLAVLAVLIITAALMQKPASDSTPEAEPYPVRFMEIASAASDPRWYRFVQLSSNSLPVLLISDPDTDSAAAAMSVGTGSSSDPRDRNGLAHFLEHMLFMGSKDFPDENAYAAFLAARGGGSNAYTAEEETTFFFDIQSTPGNLAGALPLFAGFFTAPLLRADGVSREMRAVASEHAKNLLNDEWRSWQMIHELAAPQSSLHHFGTGSTQTLDFPSIVSDLRAFYKEHYRADNMALVLLGKEGLAELQQLATKLFSAVPGPKLVAPALPVQCRNDTGANATWPDPSRCVVPQAPYVRPASARPVESPFDPAATLPFAPFVAAQVSRNVTLVPINIPSHTLSLHFPLPSSKAPMAGSAAAGQAKAGRFAQDAAGYVAYILGHEGRPRTLCSLLKSLGLVRSISVGLSVDSRVVDQSLLAVEMVLTEAGNTWASRRLVLDLLFRYVAMLRDEATAPAGEGQQPGLHEQHWATMHAEAGVRFRFAEKSSPRSYASALASRLAELLPLGLPVEELLLPPGSRAYGDGSAVAEVLARLDRHNVLLIHSSSDLQDASARDALAPPEQWQSEKWYGTLYHSAPLEEWFTNGTTATDNTDPSLAMEWPPAVNQFVPASFGVIDVPALVRAAQEEAASTAPGGPKPTPAADALLATIGGYNVTRDVPLSLPLAQADGSASSNSLYYKPDAQGFGLPFAYYSVFLRFAPGFLAGDDGEGDAAGEGEPGSGVTLEGLRRQVQLQLYQSALQELLAPTQYQLAQAGLSLSLEPHPAKQGLGLNLVAYGGNVVDVWAALLPRLVDLAALGGARLAQLGQDLLAGSYQSFPTSQQPYQHGLYYQRLWEERHKATVPQLQRVLEQEGGLAAVANMTAFVRGALTQLGLSSFASGNLNISTARALHDATQAFLAGEALGSELSAAQLDRLAALNAAEVYKLSPPPGEHEEGTSYVYRQKVLNPDEENSALVFNLQIGPAGGDGGDDDDSDDESLRSSALLLLSAQLLGEAAFNVLRTQWSLGYMVWAQARQSAAAVGGHAVENFVFIVQNAHDSPRALEARVEDFLQLFHGQHLDALTEEQLTLQRATLATSLAQTRQASLSMTANHAHSWGKIFRALEPHSPPQFDRERRLESILRSDTDRNGVSWSQQLLVFFNQFFLNPATRRKSAMLLFGAAHDPSATAPEPRNMTTTTAGLLERDLELGDIDRRDEMRNATKWGPW